MTSPSVVLRNPTRRYQISLAESGWLKTLAYLQCDPQIDGTAPEQCQIAVSRAGPFIRLHEREEADRDFASIADLRDHLHSRFFMESLAGSQPLLHAACLMQQGRRILLVGPKNAGKSTLTLALALNGYEIEGDENVFIGLAGVTARPRACRVKESSLRVLPSLAPLMADTPYITDYHGRKIYNFGPDALGPPWRIATGKAAVVVLLHSNHGGMSSIRRVPPLALTRALMAETTFPALQRAAGIAGVAALAAGAVGYDLSVGQLGTAVSCINAAMQTA